MFKDGISGRWKGPFKDIKTFWVNYFTKRMAETYKYNYSDVQFMIEGGEVLLMVNSEIAKKW